MENLDFNKLNFIGLQNLPLEYPDRHYVEIDDIIKANKILMWQNNYSFLDFIADNSNYVFSEKIYNTFMKRKVMKAVCSVEPRKILLQ